MKVYGRNWVKFMIDEMIEDGEAEVLSEPDWRLLG